MDEALIFSAWAFGVFDIDYRVSIGSKIAKFLPEFILDHRTVGLFNSMKCTFIGQLIAYMPTCPMLSAELAWIDKSILTLTGN